MADNNSVSLGKFTIFCKSYIFQRFNLFTKHLGKQPISLVSNMCCHLTAILECTFVMSSVAVWWNYNRQIEVGHLCHITFFSLVLVSIIYLELSSHRRLVHVRLKVSYNVHCKYPRMSSNRIDNNTPHNVKLP